MLEADWGKREPIWPRRQRGTRMGQYSLQPRLTASARTPLGTTILTVPTIQGPQTKVQYGSTSQETNR